MSVDVAVLTPAFLDLSFVGLEALPRLGEERFAAELLRSPGGGAITAIGAARLGLDAALVSPLGDDVPGRFVAEAVGRDGVRTSTSAGARTPVTAAMVVDGERAFVSYDPDERAPASELEELQPRVVVAGFDELDMPLGEAWLYVSCGDADARARAGLPPLALGRARALFLNESEAMVLAGATSAVRAVDRLTAAVETVIVTRGPGGALAVVEGEPFDVPGFGVSPVADTTGAGDLFCAAYAWGDLRGADPEARLRWAALAAALSVTKLTGAAGAVTEAQLLEEGERRGLPAMPAGARAES
jgi:sugar/nucleoside kinase (ribokinase family)